MATISIESLARLAKTVAEQQAIDQNQFFVDEGIEK